MRSHSKKEWMKVTEMYEDMPKIEVGCMTIGAGIEEGKVWLENSMGEGGDFDANSVGQWLRHYFNKHF